MPESYAIEFWEDEQGQKPVLEWIRGELTREQRAALGKAMQHVLGTMGIGVCGTQFGKQLGDGLCEFRLRYNLAGLRHRFEEKTPPADAPEAILLRVFFHAYGVTPRCRAAAAGFGRSTRCLRRVVRRCRGRITPRMCRVGRAVSAGGRELPAAGFEDVPVTVRIGSEVFRSGRVPAVRQPSRVMPSWAEGAPEASLVSLPWWDGERASDST